MNSARCLRVFAVSYACAVGMLLPSGATASVLRSCGGALECGTVSVPLDRSGTVPGTVGLAVRRLTQSDHPGSGTIIALAGGPGQSAVDLMDGLASDLAPVLADRALVVFDARGVGRSGRIRCPYSNARTEGAVVAACAAHLGAARAFYSTADSVADIDAVREALGLDQVTVSGVSYGTLTALAYARAHPDHVDRLVLDSTLPLAGDRLFELSTVGAMRRVLDSLCTAACHGASPSRDLTRVLAYFRAHPHKTGPVAMPTSTLVGDALYNALSASDLHPLVRASLPAALHLAANGDFSAIGRLSMLTAGLSLQDGASRLEPLPRAQPASAGDSSWDAVPLATGCEDTDFPWQTGDPRAARLGKANAALAELPGEALQPFDRATIMQNSLASSCSAWPEAARNHASDPGPSPTTPTLILSGQDDIRTPLEDATALAAQLPRAQLLSVPNTGHAVLGADPSRCAKTALTDFFAGRDVQACRPAAPKAIDPFPPSLNETPTRDTSLPGLPGRVVAASILTLRHDIGFTIDAGRQLGVGFLVGTRGGLVRISRRSGRDHYRLERLSYIAGLSLSGAMSARTNHFVAGRLTVRLHGRVFGHITVGNDGHLSGRVGGHRFRVSQTRRERINERAGLTAALLR